MIRQIDVSPWKHLTTTQHYEHHTLDSIFTILIEREGEYHFIVEEEEKVFDISQMPSYIKEEWITYNKKQISISLVNEQIKKLSNDYEQFEEELELLKSIRRDLILKGLAI